MGNRQKLAMFKVAKGARAMIDFSLGRGELGEEEAARLKAVFVDEDEAIFIGAGAEDGRLKTELIVDTATINRIWKSVDIHQKANKRK